MASGHRKRKAAAIRAYVLNPANLTNVPEADRGVKLDQDNLVNLAFYASGGYSPTFTQGSATRLSDAISNADGVWSGTGVNGASGVSGGETTFGIASNTQHYSMPVVGTANAAYSSITSPVIIYSKDGPQALFSPYYITDGVVGTSSISFNTQITGAAGTFPKLKIILAGQVNSSSAGSDSVSIFTGSVTSTATLFSNALVLTSSNLIYMSASVNTASLLGFPNVLRVVFSSSATHATSTTPTAGWWVYVTGSN
jgi:hypothetical protein